MNWWRDAPARWPSSRRRIRKFTRAVLARLAGVRVIVRYGVGVDSIDLAAACEHGIMVCNVPDFGTDEVALHTVTLALALTRRIHQASADTRAGLWDLGRLRPMHSPAACVAGVIGLGRIGRATARYLDGLGFQVHGHDPFLSASALSGEPIVVRASLDELFAEADLLTPAPSRHRAKPQARPTARRSPA